jgi:hypothetical protein
MSDDFDGDPPKGFSGPGGTSGGVVEFFVGLGLLVLGAYMVARRVTVYSGFPSWFGDHTFGITLLPLLLGIGVLFFNGRAILGWVLTAGGLLIIFAGILMSLSISFAPTDLFSTIVIFGLIAAGIGLLTRSLRAH